MRENIAVGNVVGFVYYKGERAGTYRTVYIKEIGTSEIDIETYDFVTKGIRTYRIGDMDSISLVGKGNEVSADTVLSASNNESLLELYRACAPNVEQVFYNEVDKTFIVIEKAPPPPPTTNEVIRDILQLAIAVISDGGDVAKQKELLKKMKKAIDSL